MKPSFFIATFMLALAASAQTPKARPADVCSIPNQPVAITRCEPASIYVADFDRVAIEQILSQHFDGFTVLPAHGCWHKVCENSLVIQIAGATERELRQAAEELRVAGKQEQVLVVLPARQAPGSAARAGAARGEVEVPRR
jgi:hypothetical protein